jgi:hypothetical protein
MSELYTGDVAAMVREFGFAETYRRLQERKKRPEPEQGDASELDPNDWKLTIDRNKGAASDSR